MAMDYDRYDALLHWLFKQTQGDAWFRPHEENVSSGVALRVNEDPIEFRIFPYENLSLEPFETAVTALNPAVAVKVRSAAVHAALSQLPEGERSLYVDASTRIQVLDTMMQLPYASKEQCAAFIRDERVLVVWSHSLESIIPTCNDFEERLIKLLWRSRPNGSSLLSPSIGGSVGGHGSLRDSSSYSHANLQANELGASGSSNEQSEKGKPTGKVKVKRNWYGKKVGVKETTVADAESLASRRPAKLWAPLYNGIAAGLSMVFIGQGIKVLLEELVLDSDYIRLALCATIPLLYCVSLFFALQIVQNVSMVIGPVAHYHENSKYYSAIKPRPSKEVDENLPHVTIQMPVYKESLESVLTPSIESLKKAMQTYARQGGSSTIFVNDDGLRLLPQAERDERLAFYANHNIGWVARPGHGWGSRKKGDAGGVDPGFVRAGRFKKASNMNYGLALSLKVERILEDLMRDEGNEKMPTLAELARQEGELPQPQRPAATNRLSGVSQSSGATGAIVQPPRYGTQYVGRDGQDNDVEHPASESLEERALQMAIEETYEESGRRFKPWAANARASRIGEIILIVDSDTVVPEDCLRDAAREMRECPTVAIIQHESDVMQVAHHYFENGIAYFTRRINRCISMACANGEVAPFVGHNAFLRWQAIQDAAFVDPADGKEKIWSESNVSEDFDMALRLLMRGYIIRWATYSLGGFKEGVSLSVDDELNRWQKYAYGCNELLFNPLVQWWRKGPIAHQIHRFMWSNAPIHYKISMMAYMFSYYGIAAAITIGIINYVFLGFQFTVDGFYIASFEIWLATTVVFIGSGNVGYTLLQYRLGNNELLTGFLENIKWVPFFFFFFGGLAIHISVALLAHLFSYNITWSATIKEVERSNFFKEIPKIFKRFWFSMLVSFAIIAGMIICSTSLVPYAWRVDGTGWAVIFPLSIVCGCHILFPIVLNPWLMVFSY
ncbi:glycosyl transferase family group 2-domain-containing protein [Schizophyllum commune]